MYYCYPPAILFPVIRYILNYWKFIWSVCNPRYIPELIPPNNGVFKAGNGVIVAVFVGVIVRVNAHVLEIVKEIELAALACGMQ